MLELKKPNKRVVIGMTTVLEQERSDISISYGGKTISNFIPKSMNLKVLDIEPYTPTFTNIEERLKEALEHPVGMDMSFNDFIKEHYKEGKDVIFIIDDYSRPNRHTKILLPLMEKFAKEAGVKEEDMKILVAAGTHRATTDKELENKALGPELYAKWKDKIYMHNSKDPETNVDTGYKTKRGTPVIVDKRAIEASVIIPLGDFEYHYFAGIAGGPKQIVPGIAGEETVRQNHPRMFDYELGFKPECRLGNIKGNPVMEDIREIVAYLKENHLNIFAVEVIEHNKEIVWLEAGDILTLHDMSAEPLKKLREIEVDKPADLVIVDAGPNVGVNLYQSGKAIHAGWNAVRKDGKGTILVIAQCPDGVGSKGFEESMKSVVGKDYDEALRYIIDHYCSVDTFVIGNQKPVDLFRILKTVKGVYILSDMDPNELETVYRLKNIKKSPDQDPQEALREFLEQYHQENPNATVYFLGDASYLVRPK